MATRPALALHRAARPATRSGLASRTAKLATELALALALLAGGAVAVVMLSLLIVLAAPVAAGVLGWLAWRSGDATAREAARARARLRRRTRALGLVVLAGSGPALLHLRGAGGRQAAPP